MSIKMLPAITWKFLPYTSYLKFSVQTVKFWMLWILSSVVLNCEKSQGYDTGLSVVQYLLLFLFKRSFGQCKAVTVTLKIKSCFTWHLAHHRLHNTVSVLSNGMLKDDDNDDNDDDDDNNNNNGTQHSLCVSATLGKQIFGWSSPPSF
jgi:hypothetical protein